MSPNTVQTASAALTAAAEIRCERLPGMPRRSDRMENRLARREAAGARGAPGNACSAQSPNLKKKLKVLRV